MGREARAHRRLMMMTRQATFTGDRASDRHDICWTAIHLGRAMMLQDAQGKQSRDERRRDVVILKAIKACGTEASSRAVKLETGDAQRVVTPDSVLMLPQPELDRLVAVIDRVPWMTDKIEAVEDTLDWLAASDKIEG